MRVSNSLFTLPFDQFSRQLIVAEMIEALKKVTKNKSLTIVDVGGYKGKTAEFQPKDSVVVADLFDIDEPNYVKVSASSLPFADSEFGIAVTFDTFEHVPRAHRKAFIDDLLRVGSGVAILAAPFDNQTGDVHLAEVLANSSYKKLSGRDHKWLKEHIEYRIPYAEEIEDICNNARVSFFSVPTNDLTIWLTLQQLFFTAEIKTKPFPAVEGINKYYNQHISLLESSVKKDNAYRRIYFIAREETLMQNVREAYINIKEQATSSSGLTQIAARMHLFTLIHEAYNSLDEERLIP